MTPPKASKRSNTSKSSEIKIKSPDQRRPRVPYTEEEIDHLMEGANKFGTNWTSILLSYTFHPSRNAMDLKEKYSRIIVSIPLYKRYHIYIYPLKIQGQF